MIHWLSDPGPIPPQKDGLLTYMPGGSTGFIQKDLWVAESQWDELFEAGAGVAIRYPDTIVMWVGEVPGSWSS